MMKKFLIGLFFISVLTVNSYSEDLSITGEVVSDNEIIITSLSNGVISYFPWRKGDIINKSDTISAICRESYCKDRDLKQALLNTAEKTLEDFVAPPREEKVNQLKSKIDYLTNYKEFLKKDYENIKKLVEKEMMPHENYDKAYLNYLKTTSELDSVKEELKMLNEGPTETQIELKKAFVKEKQAALNLSESLLRECHIYAPFDGKVVEVYKRENEYAKVGEPLLKMYEQNKFLIRFSVSEKYYNRISKKSKVSVNIDALNGKSFNAKIIRISPNIDRTIRTFIVEVKLIGKTAKIIPGMFVRIKITLV